MSNTFLWHSLAVNVFSYLLKQNLCSWNDNHLHFWTILFQQKTFNNNICMTTHNQLHHYTTISMKVTILSAGRKTLPYFHLTLNNTSLAWFFWTEISHPIFLQNLIIEQGTRCTFLKSYFHNSPLADINSASYEPFAYNSEGAIQCTCDSDS